MDYFERAVDNISRYGDTDIFPYPIEKALFFDKRNEVVELLKSFNTNYDEFKAFKDANPITCIKTCIPSGYVGYRLATMIDPLWDACLLGLVLNISEDIEASRSPIDKDSVFSYRLKLKNNDHKLFNRDVNWRKFFEIAKEIAKNKAYVVKFDIADFYNRIYHHRLENTLKRCTTNSDVVKKIMEILQDISGNVSYGLPVGGNAARILAEAFLVNLDSMLSIKNIRFCRYVDDYILFADSKDEAYKHLNYCADFLLRNEGLSLSKNKTHIMTQSEFITYVESTLKCANDDSKDDDKESLLKLRIHYDPYSNTADEDYLELKRKIGEHDIVKLINAEVKKSRIHQAFSKQLFKAISLLEGERLDAAFLQIMSNLDGSLYPVYPNVMSLAYQKLNDCSNSVKSDFIGILCNLVEADSYVIQSENNAAYTCRVLSLMNSEQACQAVEKLYQINLPLVQVNCVYAMINMNQFSWLSDQKQRYASFEDRVKRAYIAASYFLGDEGSHWRSSKKREFNAFEKLMRDWVVSKNTSNNTWKLPL